MKVVSLKSESRQGSGKADARRSRAAGKVPAIVYGEGRPAESIALSTHEFRLAVSHGARVIDLEDGSAPAQRVLLSEVQYDALGMNPVHADFLRMDPNHEITLAVPIEFEGAPKGRADGG